MSVAHRQWAKSVTMTLLSFLKHFFMSVTSTICVDHFTFAMTFLSDFILYALLLMLMPLAVAVFFFYLTFKAIKGKLNTQHYQANNN
jgi:hypothetical protein